jgi:hypothetical protein
MASTVAWHGGDDQQCSGQHDGNHDENSRLMGIFTACCGKTTDNFSCMLFTGFKLIDLDDLYVFALSVD